MCQPSGSNGDEYTFDNGPMGMRLNCGVIVPNLLNDPLFEYMDNFSWTHGKHAFKSAASAISANGRICVPAIYRRAVRQSRGHGNPESLATETAGTGTPPLGPTLLPAGQTYAAREISSGQTSRTLAANLAYC